jgi:hypothetical protein
MRALIVAGFLVAGDSIGASAQTQGQPWCAYFTGGEVNCKFATFQECLEAIHGKTGLCEQTPQNDAPAAPALKPGHRTDKAHR